MFFRVNANDVCGAKQRFIFPLIGRKTCCSGDPNDLCDSTGRSADAPQLRGKQTHYTLGQMEALAEAEV